MDDQKAESSESEQTFIYSNSSSDSPSTSCSVCVILTPILMSVLQHSCHILEIVFGDVYIHFPNTGNSEVEICARLLFRHSGSHCLGRWICNLLNAPSEKSITDRDLVMVLLVNLCWSGFGSCRDHIKPPLFIDYPAWGSICLPLSKI